MIKKILGYGIVLFLFLIALLASGLYLALAQDDVLVSFESGSVLTVDDTQVTNVGRMKVYVTDAALDLSELAAGEEVKTGNIYQLVTSHMQILLPCEIVAGSFTTSSSEWASGAIVLSYTVDNKPACAISLMIVDHRSPRIPWPEAPGLHGV